MVGLEVFGRSVVATHYLPYLMASMMVVLGEEKDTHVVSL
jgi:hypothetical protein